MTNNSWQGGEALKVVENMEKLSSVAATVMNSKIYVIRSYRECERRLGWVNKPAVVHCFDPKYNFGQNSRQPAILILNPVFLLSITNCVWRGRY